MYMATHCLPWNSTQGHLAPYTVADTETADGVLSSVALVLHAHIISVSLRYRTKI